MSVCSSWTGAKDVLRGLATSHNNVGILLEHSTANRIVNGSAIDNRFMGVFLVSSSDRNEIRNNTISGSVLTPGLLLDDSDHNRAREERDRPATTRASRAPVAATTTTSPGTGCHTISEARSAPMTAPATG